MSCHGDVIIHFPLVWRACRSFARERRESHPEDSDTFSEALLYLLKALETFDDSKGMKLESWIVTVVKTGLLQQKRYESAKRRSAKLDLEFDLNSAETPLESYPSEDVETLRNAIDSLPDERQRTIAEQRLNGCEWHEIGRNVGLTRSNASLLFRSKVLPQLQESLGVNCP